MMKTWCADHGTKVRYCDPCFFKTCGQYYRSGKTMGRIQGALVILLIDSLIAAFLLVEIAR